LDSELKGGIKIRSLPTFPVRYIYQTALRVGYSSAVERPPFPAGTPLFSKEDFILKLFLQGVQQNEK